jgi:hypothetical protein
MEKVKKHRGKPKLKIKLNYFNLLDEAVEKEISIVRLLWDKYVPKTALPSSVLIIDNDLTDRVTIWYKNRGKEQCPI